jgi:tetratricopeptide (TPR) repeat protein
MTAPRGLIGLGIAAWLAIAPAAFAAQGQTMAERSAEAAFVFSAQATQNAVVKAMDDDLSAQRHRAEGLAVQLVSTRAQLVAAQASKGKAARLQVELDQLSRDTAAAQEAFATQLAAKDQAYARELAALRGAADTILATPDGLHVLELANAGDWQGVKVLETSIRAARQHQRDLQAAADARAFAVLALDAAAKGREQVSAVIDRYDEVTRLDPGHYDDWLALAGLYRQANDLTDAARAVKTAQALAATDAEQVEAGLVAGDIDAALGDHAGALAAERAAQAAADRWLARAPASLDALRARIAALAAVAQEQRAQGDLTGAVASFRAMGAASMTLLKSGHAAQADVEAMDGPMAALAQMLLQGGRPADALALAQSAAGLDRGFIAGRPDDLRLKLDLAVLRVIAGDALEAQGDLAGARAADEEALALDQGVVGKDPSFVAARATMSVDLDRLGRIQARQGDLVGSLSRFQEELKLRRALAVDDPASAEHPLAIIIADGELAEVERARGDPAVARAAADEALALARDLVGREPALSVARAALADAQDRAARLHKETP